jgi:hypothetical protein
VAQLSQQLGQQSALGSVLDPLDRADQPALSQISWLRSSQCRCHRVSQRQSYSDDDYSEGDKLDQIIWPFSVGVSITDETRSSNAQRVGSFHIYRTPFTNEMTISWAVKWTTISVSALHGKSNAAVTLRRPPTALALPSFENFIRPHTIRRMRTVSPSIFLFVAVTCIAKSAPVSETDLNSAVGFSFQLAWLVEN